MLLLEGIKNDDKNTSSNTFDASSDDSVTKKEVVSDDESVRTIDFNEYSDDYDALIGSLVGRSHRE